MRQLVGILCLLATLPAGVSGQASYALSRPQAALTTPFSQIRSVRELPDGKLLVADWLEQRVALVDLETGTVVDRGREGSGPAEYRLPSALLPFRGDSTLLVDAGNGRLGVLDVTGAIQRFLQPPHEAAKNPFGADTSGRVYFTIAPWHARTPLSGDSMDLAVWDTETGTVRTLSRVHGWTPSRQKPGEGPRIPYVVFAPQDTWAVTAGGAVAVVRDRGYYVEWVGSARGPRQPGPATPATAEDRRVAVSGFAATAAVGGRGSDGGTGLEAASAEERSPAALAALERASTFAGTLPAFRVGSARASAAGHLWVGRWDRPGQPVRYDVFDPAGVLLATVQFPADVRLLTVGVDHAYLAHSDEHDLQYLQRYLLPTPLRARPAAR